MDGADVTETDSVVFLKRIFTVTLIRRR